MALGLRADFAANAILPKANVYTDCGGTNISPALRWSDAPTRTRSFVLTVFDPDAPGPGGWWHWIAFNIPGAARSLPANAGAKPSGTNGTFGANDFGNKRYDGPCPPPGKPHRYVFTLYALSVPHVIIADGKDVHAAIKGRVLESTQLIGVYGR